MQYLIIGDPSEKLIEPLPKNAEPVRAHCRHGCRVRDDGGCPVNGVDLGHQGRVDKPRRVVQLLVGHFRVLRGKLVELGNIPMAMSPADYRALIASENDKWSKVIKFAGIKLG